MEKAETTGALSIKNLSRALEAMGKAMAFLAFEAKPIRKATWDHSIVSAVEPDPFGSKKVILDARFGARTATIAGECVALGIAMSVEDLWLVIEGVSVDCPLDIYNQVRSVASSYDLLVKSVASNRWVPDARTDVGQPIPAPDNPTLVSSLDWMFTAIRNSSSWHRAYRQSSALLLQQGYRWPWLPRTQQFRQDWESAIGVLRSVGKADKVATLMLHGLSKELR
jgi:hypothetical protein